MAKNLVKAFDVTRCPLDPDIKEALEWRLDRAPTKTEIKQFCDYLDIDYPQWISDNTKSFVRDKVLE